MKLAVPKELAPGEQRVALVPGDLARLTGAGVETSVQRGAGALALYADKDYEEAGAKLVDGAGELFDGADLVAKVQPPTMGEVDQLREGTCPAQFPGAIGHGSTSSSVWRAARSQLSVLSSCPG